MSPRGVRIVLPAVLLTATGCAMRSDIEMLQNDIGVMRTEAAQADSARRRQLDQTLAGVTAANDSIRALAARVRKMQGDLQGNMYSMEQELIQIQELTGQSQRRLQELRGSLEQRSQQGQGTVTPPGAGAPPTRPPATGTAPGTAPGPNQLFQLSLDQLRRGSTGTARAGFQDLLRQYPSSDVAADAQFYIAESYATEGKKAAADSAYALVVSTYPTSNRAPTALYKRAVAMQNAGNAAGARAAFEEVIRRYPRSDEAVLARERARGAR